MSVTVRQMLRHKHEVHTVRPHDTVYDALRVMAEHNIGAVVVLAGNEITGILSERDYARKGILQGKASKDTPVSEIMTPRVVCVDPTLTAEHCMSLMTEKHIRHLPVVEDGRLIGVISIGDVVRAVLEEQQTRIVALEDYIRSA